MLVDANILIYSVDESSPFHAASRDWLVEALNGPARVGLPWLSLWAFQRVMTNPRALAEPLSPADAWSFVANWLAAPSAWVVTPGRGHADILARLLVDHDARGNLVTDAVLAALCLEHGLAIVSADSDFARFPQVTWVNPIRPG